MIDQQTKAIEFREFAWALVPPATEIEEMQRNLIRLLEDQIRSLDEVIEAQRELINITQPFLEKAIAPTNLKDERE